MWYITCSQNDVGIASAGNKPDALRMSDWPNILVLSAGGYGHVPIPLLKQTESPAQKLTPAKRTYNVSYVGSVKHAPCNLREKMLGVMRQFSGTTAYKGSNWRQVMAQSK